MFLKKAYRYSKRIVNRNTTAVKEEYEGSLTKCRFLGFFELIPVDEPDPRHMLVKDEDAPKREKRPKQKLHCDTDHSPRSVTCKLCGCCFGNRRLLKKHSAQHEGRRPYACSQCKRSFQSLDFLVAHIRRHNGKLPYECKICKESFCAYKAYSKHQSVHMLLKIEYPKVKVFKCDACPKEFRKLCDLERHMRVHTGEKPFTCLLCQKSFQQAHNLTKHMIIHTKDKRFKCEVCGKEFGRSDVLNRHMITHVVDKPHHCGFCPKSFGRYSQLMEHAKKHHQGVAVPS